MEFPRIKNFLDNILCLPFYKEFYSLPRILKQFNINVIFKYDSSIKSVLIKNNPKEQCIGGVYCIPCTSCEKTYLGQTGKQCEKRLAQPKYNVRTANESSGIFIHVRDYDHRINWKETKMIFKSNDVYERLIVESCLIDRTNMNLMPGFYKVDNIMKSKIFEAPKIKRAITSLQPP